MPPKTAQRPNFLLKITLVKTTDPTVTRLISVPFDLTFAELHLAIAAAFGWEDACTTWLFRIWSADPVQHCDQLKNKGGVAIYCTAPGFGFEVKPMSLRTDVKIGQQFKKEGSGRFWTYDYDISRFHHAIEVVDTLNDDQRGTIGSLGGQGQVSRKVWQYADLGGLEGVTVGAKSTWDLDMRLLNQRLKGVQDAYEQRKGNEATKATAKQKAQPKDNATQPTSAKGTSKSKEPSQTKAPKETGQPGPIPAAIGDNVLSTTATSKPANTTPAATTPPKPNTPAVPIPAEAPAPQKSTPAKPKPAPSKAAKATTTAKPKPQAVAAPQTPLHTGTLSEKRPLRSGSRGYIEVARKRYKLLKSESVVKDEDEEEEDVIRLGSESP